MLICKFIALFRFLTINPRLYMSPPLGTLVLKFPQDLADDAALGIDTQFLTAQGLLKGIKMIPTGLHLFHFTSSVLTGDSMRYGWWFYIEEGQILSVEWDQEKAIFTIEQPNEDFAAAYQYMVDYPEDLSKWNSLTKYIDAEALDEYNPAPPEPISTATPLLEENMVLFDILKLRQPSLQLDDQTGQELKYTVVQEKLQQEDTTGQDLTKSALDRSWQFQTLFGHDVELFVAELQLSFVHFVVLGNLCSCTQWISLLRLGLRSESFLTSNDKFSALLLDTITLQFDTLPKEYVDELLPVQIPELEKCREIMIRFSDCFEPRGSLRSKWLRLQQIVQGKLSLEFCAHSEFDADNFEVYDFKHHDDCDEDAPAIVYS